MKERKEQIREERKDHIGEREKGTHRGKRERNKYEKKERIT